jgi:hypothetical protein
MESPADPLGERNEQQIRHGGAQPWAHHQEKPAGKCARSFFIDESAEPELAGPNWEGFERASVLLECIKSEWEGSPDGIQVCQPAPKRAAKSR